MESQKKDIREVIDGGNEIYISTRREAVENKSENDSHIRINFRTQGLGPEVARVIERRVHTRRHKT